MVEKNPDRISKMFSAIAPSYDFLNMFLSGGRDRKWRKEGIKALDPGDGIYLDLAAGTCDFAIELRRRSEISKIIAADFSHEMLVIGKRKTSGARIHIARGDALELCFPPRSFDGIICAFGIRNFQNLDRGLGEMLRVLKPGGKVVALEFTTPANPVVKWFYLLYFTKILPLIGGVISGNYEAYSYLPRSAILFPDRRKLVKIFEVAGYRNVRVNPLTFGICDLVYAEKPG